MGRFFQQSFCFNPVHRTGVSTLITKSAAFMPALMESHSFWNIFSPWVQTRSRPVEKPMKTRENGVCRILRTQFFVLRNGPGNQKFGPDVLFIDTTGPGPASFSLPLHIIYARPRQKSERRPPARLETVEFPTRRAGGRRSKRNHGAFCRGLMAALPPSAASPDHRPAIPGWVSRQPNAKVPRGTAEKPGGRPQVVAVRKHLSSLVSSYLSCLADLKENAKLESSARWQPGGGRRA